MFEYLKKYCHHSNYPEASFADNNFYPVGQEEIERLEGLLGCKIPAQLKMFYKEIGYGFLTHPHKYDSDYIFSNTNRISAPDTIVEMLEKGQESGYISEDVYEELQPGDIPFFEVADSSWFFKMKALSDNPNAVWDTGEYEPLKIADSLEEFIYKLYYEDAQYYGDIYSARVKAREEKQK